MENSMKFEKKLTTLAVASALAFSAITAQAAVWSDTSISWREGNSFAEPYETNDITKNILNLSHVSGYKYGTNFFSVDMLYADSKDPSAIGSTNGSSEVYIVYRNTVEFSKAIGGSYKFGPVRDIGATIGFDTNTKTDTGYNSKKQMLVFGPTFEMDVPGFLNVSILELWESNAPSGWSFYPNPAYGIQGNSTYSVDRYHYAPHPMLSLAWGIPIATGFSFEGFMDYIAAKGIDETGNATKPETHFDGQIMADVGYFAGGPKGTFKAGIEYEWWQNKFGADYTGPAGNGAFAKTPMVRVEYHF
jgi:hypothetical protein